MKKHYIFSLIIAVFVLLASAGQVSAQVYNPTMDSQRAQVQSILNMVQSLPGYTNEQITRKIQLLQQALQLQLQINSADYTSSNSYNSYNTSGYNYSNNYSSGSGTGNDPYPSYNTNYYTYPTYQNSPAPVPMQLDAVTGAVDQGTPTSARLTGRVTRTGNTQESIQSWFEWGIYPNLDAIYNVNATPKTTFGVQSGTIGTSASIYNLQPSTKYYYRLNIMSSAGLVRKGQVMDFTTFPLYQTQSFYYNY